MIINMTGYHYGTKNKKSNKKNKYLTKINSKSMIIKM